MYYLQSRYYDPELCRFISADSFSYVDNNAPLNVNAYAYCVNNPVNYSDPAGNYPVVEKIENLRNRIESKFIALIKKTVEFAEKEWRKIKQRIIKLKQKFKLIKYRIKRRINNFAIKIMDRLHIFTDTAYFELPTLASSKQTDNWLEAALRSLSFGFVANEIIALIEKAFKSFNRNFDFNKWYNGLSKKNQDFFSELIKYLTTGIFTLYSKYKDSDEYGEMLNKIADSSLEKVLVNLFEYLGKKLSYINGGGQIYEMWKLFADVFNKMFSEEYNTIQGFEKFTLNLAYIIVSFAFPNHAIIVSIMAVIGNLVLDISFNYDEGNYWG